MQRGGRASVGWLPSDDLIFDHSGLHRVPALALGMAGTPSPAPRRAGFFSDFLCGISICMVSMPNHLTRTAELSAANGADRFDFHSR